jgi:hypothetical protein
MNMGLYALFEASDGEYQLPGRLDWRGVRH